MAYSYYKTITIDNAKVGGDEVDFPLVINIASDNNLRTVGNGGQIQNTDATGTIIGNVTVPADLVFSPNSDGSAPYDFEYEYYDATTGALIAHVRLPTMSSGTPTVLYMAYGDAGVVASQETIATVWDASFKAVHHKHGAAWAEILDSTATGSDADGEGGNPTYQHPSQIGYGVDYDGDDCHTLNGVLANIEGLNEGTFECWFTQDANGLNCAFFISDKDSNNDFAGMFIGAWTGDYADESLAWIVRRGGATALYMVVRNGHDFYNDGDRHHVVVITGDGANRIIIDGVNQAITFAAGAINTNEFTNINNPDTMWMAGRKITAGNNYLTGELDEIRISNSARSTNWAVSCYNNQFSPGTFYSIGAQQGGVVNRAVSQEGVLVEYRDTAAELDQFLPVLEVREAVYAELDQLVIVLEVFEPVRSVSQEGVFTEYLHPQRGVSQEGVLVDHLHPQRGVSQEGVNVEYQQPQRGVSQEGVLVEFDMPDDEGRTQIAGTSQIQPWSIHPDRLHPSVAGAGLAGGGPDGALRIDTTLYPQPTAQGQALVANATPAWTASLTPTWLGEHVFNAGILMGANLDLNGVDLILDVDGDSYLHSPADDQIDSVVPTGGQIRCNVISDIESRLGTALGWAALEVESNARTNIIVHGDASDIGGATATWTGFGILVGGSEKWHIGLDATATDRVLYFRSNAINDEMVLNAGDLGIGLINPAYRLDVYRSANEAAAIQIQNDNVGNASLAQLRVMGQGNNLFINCYGDGHATRANSNWIYTTAGLSSLVLGTASTARITILTGGDVGFGTPTPFGPFHTFDSPGSGMFVTADNVAGGAVTIVPNAAGDVASGLTVLYRVLESAGGVSGGSATVNNNSSVDLYDDGTDILTLAVAADGSATLQRTAGAATFDVSLWMVWL